MICLSRNMSRNPEGWIYVFRIRSSLQKGHRHFKRVNGRESYIQKGNFQKVNSHEVPHPQNFFCTIHGSFLKVKFGKTRSKRSTDKFEKLVYINSYFFSSSMTLLLAKKESNPFVTSSKHSTILKSQYHTQELLLLLSRTLYDSTLRSSSISRVNSSYSGCLRYFLSYRR